MPEPNLELLTSLEQDGVPTIHNMILGDRVVSRLDYQLALSYATFLATRLVELYGELEPSVVIGGFDSLHGGIALAVARRMDIPWFAFSVWRAAGGTSLSMQGDVPRGARAVGCRIPVCILAEVLLKKFEDESIHAPAYITPRPPSLLGNIKRLPCSIGGGQEDHAEGAVQRWLAVHGGREQTTV